MQKKERNNQLDFTGKRFGRLVATRKIGTGRWEFVCDCGNTIVLNCSRILCGQKSCGCLGKESRQQFVKSITTHGESKTKLYRKWFSMKQRCFNPKNVSFSRYGGRGITMCEEWLDFSTFSKWAYENGYDSQKDGHFWSIDRIDNNGDYCPTNCRFTTAKEQMINRSITKRIEYKGRMMCVPDIADEVGITDTLFIYKRLSRGKSIESIIDEWNKMHLDGYIPSAECAKLLGVTITTVNRWIHIGKVKSVRAGYKWYVATESIEERRETDG